LGTEGEDEEEKLERKRRSEKLWLSLEEEKRVGEKRRAEERWRRRIVEKRSPEEKAIKEEEENEDFIEVAVAFAVWPSFRETEKDRVLPFWGEKTLFLRPEGFFCLFHADCKTKHILES
jgi:hypothetical protein